MRMVTAYLVSCGLQVPSLVPTVDGKPFACDMRGGRWRVYPWLPGCVVESLPELVHGDLKISNLIFRVVP